MDRSFGRSGPPRVQPSSTHHAQRSCDVSSSPQSVIRNGADTDSRFVQASHRYIRLFWVFWVLSYPCTSAARSGCIQPSAYYQKICFGFDQGIQSSVFSCFGCKDTEAIPAHIAEVSQRCCQIPHCKLAANVPCKLSFCSFALVYWTDGGYV